MDIALASTARPEARKEREPDAVSALTALLSEDIARADALILDRIGSSVPLIPAVAQHLIGSGGKRLRPLVALAAARLFGYAGAGHVKLAAAVELIHTATLLHDDVVDASALRRGRDTASLVFGNGASVLVGDFLLAQGFAVMVEADEPRALAVLSAAAAVIAEGEVMQLAGAGDIGLTRARYLAIVEAKTAALFAAAARAGGAVAECGDEAEATLEAFGRAFGIAFQLVDDALDYEGAAAALGKAPGDDFREGKPTLPVVLAYGRGDAAERAFWARAFAAPERDAADFAEAAARLRRHGALAETRHEARRFAAGARRELSRLPASAVRDALDRLTAFAVDRDY